MIFSPCLLIKNRSARNYLWNKPKHAPFLKKNFFQPMNFRHFEQNDGYFGCLSEYSWGFFLGIVHIFLDVSTKFQLYNIFFWVKLWNDCTKAIYLKSNYLLITEPVNSSQNTDLSPSICEIKFDWKESAKISLLKFS